MSTFARQSHACANDTVPMSKAVHLDEIPYCPDSGELFERIRDLPRAALLDSSYPHASGGRYDILTA